ncbi:MAG: hypothetical protein WAW61_06820 [Methylococcaceae bacterium]
MADNILCDKSKKHKYSCIQNSHNGFQLRLGDIGLMLGIDQDGVCKAFLKVLTMLAEKLCGRYNILYPDIGLG